MQKVPFSALACVAALGLAQIPAVAQTAPPPAAVHLKDFAFRPAVLTIREGESVTFVNDDDEAHTVTASDKKTFDSAGLDSGRSWAHTFTKAGTYEYFCELHPYMKGTIVVTRATDAPHEGVRR